MSRAGLASLFLGPALLLLAGCQEDRGERPIHVEDGTYRLEKGVYRGAADTPLTVEQAHALQQRTAAQRW